MSPPSDDYRFAIDYLNPDGARIGSLVCEPDWSPAREWLKHLGLRRALPRERWEQASIVAAPVWHETLGPPTCSGVHVALADDGESLGFDVPPEYFQEIAEENARQLVADGALEAGGRFLFHLTAFPVDASTSGRSVHTDGVGHEDGFRVEAVYEALPVTPEPLAARLAAAEPRGEHDDEDLPALLPRHVLAQTNEWARRAGDVESGSFLLGRLCECPDTGHFFVSVTAAVAAEYGEASSGSFTFTPETWGDLDRTLRLRGRGELVVGWAHSHPCWCRNCPEERARSCAFSQPFFSDDDKHLHRTCFPAAHQIALLISDVPGRGLVPTLYGWRRGMIVERAYHECID